MGRAIVLALQSKSVESNLLFKNIFEDNKEFIGKKKRAENKRNNPPQEMLRWINPRFRFWLAEALYYNQRGGIRDEDVPKPLRDIRELAEAEAKRKK